MSGLEDSLAQIIDKLVQVGAKICVISDVSGLSIATRSQLSDEDAEMALAALSSLVISTGDTIATELEGNFKNITIRTSGGILLSSAIDSDPQLLITVIAKEEEEDLMIHEMNKVKPMIAQYIAGITVELPTDTFDPNKQKIAAFFQSLDKRVETSNELNALVHVILSSKDDLFTLVNSGTVSYEMNRYAFKLEKLRKKPTFVEEDFLKIKKEIKKSIKNWQERLS